MALGLVKSMEKLKVLRGMADLLPKETAIWQRIEATAQLHFTRAAIIQIAECLFVVIKIIFFR